jgi:hypothetical protein
VPGEADNVLTTMSIISVESNGLRLLLATLLLDLLRLLRLPLLLLHPLPLGLVPVRLGLHEVAFEPNFLLEVDVLSVGGGTMREVLP